MPDNFFQYCQPVQNQPKSHILFHKKDFLRNLYIMTLDKTLKSRKFKNSNTTSWCFLVPLVLVDSIVCTYFPLFCIIYGLLDMQSMRVLWYLFYTLAYFLRILLFKNAHSSTLFCTFVTILLWCYIWSFQDFQFFQLRLTLFDSVWADVGSSHVFRVIEQCCFNSVSDPFNG